MPTRGRPSACRGTARSRRRAGPPGRRPPRPRPRPAPGRTPPGRRRRARSGSGRTDGRPGSGRAWPRPGACRPRAARRATGARLSSPCVNPSTSSAMTVGLRVADQEVSDLQRVDVALVPRGDHEAGPEADRLPPVEQGEAEPAALRHHGQAAGHQVGQPAAVVHGRAERGGHPVRHVEEPLAVRPEQPDPGVAGDPAPARPARPGPPRPARRSRS